MSEATSPSFSVSAFLVSMLLRLEQPIAHHHKGMEVELPGIAESDEY